MNYDYNSIAVNRYAIASTWECLKVEMHVWSCTGINNLATAGTRRRINGFLSWCLKSIGVLVLIFYIEGWKQIAK